MRNLFPTNKLILSSFRKRFVSAFDAIQINENSNAVVVVVVVVVVAIAKPFVPSLLIAIFYYTAFFISVKEFCNQKYGLEVRKPPEMTQK